MSNLSDNEIMDDYYDPFDEQHFAETSAEDDTGSGYAVLVHHPLLGPCLLDRDDNRLFLVSDPDRSPPGRIYSDPAERIAKPTPDIAGAFEAVGQGKLTAPPGGWGQGNQDRAEIMIALWEAQCRRELG